MSEKIQDTEYYSPEDFIKAPKYDAHIHYHTFDDSFVRKAARANMHLLSINTDFDFSIDTQFEVCQSLKKRHPQTFDFLGTFNASAFTSETFAEDTIEHIKKCRAAGARGIKIWKNVGLLVKNEAGQYLMADDPVFDPIYAFLEKEKIPLLAHLGNNHNCWLPIEQMTVSCDVRYYMKNPDHHMYLHPETPSYERQIKARDSILERYPDMIFIGAHLGSMEWNLEEVAKRMEQFPNFYIDLSGRYNHIFDYTFRHREQVIDFFEKYSNRIMYGTDWLVSKYNRREWMKLFCKLFPRVYMELLFRHMCRMFKVQWLFYATDQVINTGKFSTNPENPEHIKGLKLSKTIVDRIFYENAQSVF